MKCEECIKVIAPGDPISNLHDGPDLCADCGPTYEDVQAAGYVIDERCNEVPSAPIVQAHLDNGGALTDAYTN